MCVFGRVRIKTPRYLEKSSRRMEFFPGDHCQIQYPDAGVQTIVNEETKYDLQDGISGRSSSLTNLS